MSGTARRGAEWRLYIAGLVLVDLALVAAAFGLAYIVRFHIGWLALQEQVADMRDYVFVGAIALPAWIAIFFACGLYRRELLLGGPHEYARLVNACTFGFAAIAMLSFLSAGSPSVSRGWLVACWPLAILPTGAGRFVMRRLAYRLRRYGLFVGLARIVGVNAEAVAIAHQIERPADSGVRVVGFLDDYLPRGALVDGKWPVLGPPAALSTVGVDEAIVVQHALQWESLHDLMRALAAGTPGPAIRLAPTFFDLLTAGMTVSQRANVPVIAVNRSRIAGLDAVLKTGFEYALSAALLLALAPLLATEALRRSLCRRPVFERRRYAGTRGRVVEVTTFAGGSPDTPRLLRLVFKAPALVSVLRGHVALIGPRLMAATGTGRGAEQLALLSVKPGLTGPVSVAGGDLGPEGALALELSYIRNYSIWRDLQIVWQRAVRLLLPGGRVRHPEQGNPAPVTDEEGVPPTPISSRERR